MRKQFKYQIALALTLSLGFGVLVTNVSTSQAETDASQHAMSGSQIVVIKGEDWGPAVYKTVIELDADVAADSVTKESFRVEETMANFRYGMASPEAVKNDREIIDAYPSDAEGGKVSQDTNCIVIEISM